MYNNKHYYKIIYLQLFFVLSILVSSFSIEKSGVISGSERWTAEESPYVIQDDLLISEDAHVIINPGVKVIVGKPLSFISGINQIDRLDSFTISIKIAGAFKCIGRIDNRISFSAQYPESKECQWYGIILDPAYDGDIEISYTDVANACNGLTIYNCSPMIRNCIFEFNNVGISCQSKSYPKIYNSNIIYNTTTGIFVKNSNPEIMNCIIAFNRNNGIWSDKISFISLRYNCIFDNGADNLIGCNPELGIIKRKNKNKDSTDFAFNLYFDPVFAGSSADSQAIELDLSLQTDKSRIKDTTLAKVLYTELTDSSAIKHISKIYERYSLSRYSPCIDAGNPSKIFNDIDGSKNDMGIYGGQEFFDLEKD